jgi:aminoglycoside phosphotransferase family enzyme
LADAQRALIDWLSRGGPWGEQPAVVETHAAIVFLAGARAFKLKKAVDLGYLDFSTVEKRRMVLERELALNRRTAPSFYLRLVPVARAGDGFQLGGDGEAVDWLLEMRRFADDALLSHKAEHGALDEAVVERLAVHVARFHDAAQAVAGDWPAAVARNAR